MIPMQPGLELPRDLPYSQRWRRRKSHLVLAQSGFKPEHYHVEPFRQAKGKIPLAFVREHHYSGTVASPNLSYGLWRRWDEQLVGVATLDVGMNDRTLTNPFRELLGLKKMALYSKALELGRFVLLDEVPARAETWFLARCFEYAEAQGLRGVVSFSDPLPRRDIDGDLVFPGHVGMIYQASNALYAQRGTPRTLPLMPDGRIFGERGRSKARNGESGGDGRIAHLVGLGADPPAPGEPMAAWATRALKQAGARPLRHKGNHRYLFRLRPKTILVAVPILPYPKVVDPEVQYRP